MNFLDTEQVDIFVIRNSNTFARACEAVFSKNSFVFKREDLNVLSFSMEKIMPHCSDIFLSGGADFSAEVMNEVLEQAITNAFLKDGLLGTRLSDKIKALSHYNETAISPVMKNFLENYYLSETEKSSPIPTESIPKDCIPQSVSQKDLEEFIQKKVEHVKEFALHNLSTLLGLRTKKADETLIIEELPITKDAIKERLLSGRHTCKQKPLISPV